MIAINTNAEILGNHALFSLAALYAIRADAWRDLQFLDRLDQDMPMSRQADLRAIRAAQEEIEWFDCAIGLYL